MGAVNSRDLFGLDELILFAFYFQNRCRYRKVVDLGANIGVHTVVLAGLGYSVDSYEPDPVHSSRARETVSRNLPDATRVRWHEVAIVPEENVGSGDVEFVRVLGNTTSSHVKGAKDPYGELETFRVQAEGVRTALKSAELVKMDVEGLEADLIESLLRSDENVMLPDIMCEVGSKQNSQRIFELAQLRRVRMFSQKVNWSEVKDLNDLPTSYREGSLFLTTSDEGPWR